MLTHTQPKNAAIATTNAAASGSIVTAAMFMLLQIGAFGCGLSASMTDRLTRASLGLGER